MRGLVIAVIMLGPLGSAAAQLTERISVDSSGVEANYGADVPSPSVGFVSADGRFVVFNSGATNLVPGDTNGNWDVFIRDRLSGSTECASVSAAGTFGNGLSGGYGVAITADGRCVVFESRANNLVSGDTNGKSDIFLRDRQNGSIERVSVGAGGVEANADCLHPSVSPDGRFVLFNSSASNLVAGDANAQMDVFLVDRRTGAIELVSVSTGGVQGNAISELPIISTDGRFVAFDSDASNLVFGDTNGSVDVFLRDRVAGTTTRLSVNSAWMQGNGHSALCCFSADARYVAFMSAATNLVAGDTNAHDDVFIRDRQTSTTQRVSVSAGGGQSDGHSTQPSLSADARYVAFKSTSTNLLPGSPLSLNTRIYVRDLLAGTTELVSLTNFGVEPSNPSSGDPWISADGRYVVFESYGTDLVHGDMNAAPDIFIRDRFASGFTSICDPGTNNVIACPCNNPPSMPGRGCDNSSSTGGAALSASGIAYLSQDSLVFTTTGEKSSATSILLQGTSVNPAGVLMGQGVRCVDGTMKRLYIKTASGGSITAPDFASGDPSVSARSAALGVPLQAGVPSAYLVYYRDPIILGGCAPGSTFTATQTGTVVYWP